MVSQESKEDMHKYYARKVPNLVLAAENGFFWRWNSHDKDHNEWNQLMRLDDDVWKQEVRFIMEQYTRKT